MARRVVVLCAFVVLVQYDWVLDGGECLSGLGDGGCVGLSFADAVGDPACVFHFDWEMSDGGEGRWGLVLCVYHANQTDEAGDDGEYFISPSCVC